MEPSTDIKKASVAIYVLVADTTGRWRQEDCWAKLFADADSCILGHQILDLAGVSVQTFIRGEFESVPSA